MSAGAHDPSSAGTSKGNGPAASHAGENVPGGAFVRSPRGATGICGYDYIAQERLALGIADTFLPDIAQSKNCACDRRGVAQLPGLTAISGNCGARIIGVAGIEVASTDDAVHRVAEIDGECARARRTDERSVVSVPR